ncbi:hypothetical protein BDW75DRAFT_247192 [Aspergillus navahoensis]
MSLHFVGPIHPREPSISARLPRRTKRSAACTACKARRSRCGGGYPCDRCLESGSECVFAGIDRRRKYAQRRIEQELGTVQGLLDQIIEAFDNRSLDQLGKILEKVKEQRAGGRGQRQDSQSAGHRARSANVNDNRGVFECTRRDGSPYSSYSSVGSLDGVDILTEDPNRTEESRATGYIGKESEIAWMQGLETEARKLSGGQKGPTDESIASMCYHLDNLPITDPAPVDPRLLPPRPWAARLVDIFFGSIAPSFPLLNRKLFMSQFETAFSGSSQPTGKWLAVLNLVFAVSTKYYQHAEPVAGKDVDDRVFLSRALSLRSSHHLVLENVDLHEVQIDLLLAIYYLVSGQVNGSWRLNGSAARSAICLGLNLRVYSEHMDPISTETRTRIWWAIFSLEQLLSGMTGRVPCVDHRAMSLYPPVPYDESDFDDSQLKTILGMHHQREKRLRFTIYATDEELAARTAWLQSIKPNASLYFFHLVDLSIITHAAVMDIYSLQSTRESHSGRGQSEIPHYQSRLQSWVSNLHPAFAFTDKENVNELSLSKDSRAQVTLALSYYSSQIILSRPCLTRPDFKEGTNIRFPRSRFGNDTARTCIHSALSLISVLPDEPDTTWMLRKSPWWCILHYIMQAITVLLIELSIGFVADDVAAPGKKQGQEQAKEHKQDKGNRHAPEAVWNASKKALRWLQCMAKQDPSSGRAFEISEGFLRRIAKAKNLEMDFLQGTGTREDTRMSGFDLRDQEREYTRKRSLASSLLHQELMNWGPDCTISEGYYEQEQQQHAFVLDPALFTVEM